VKSFSLIQRLRNKIKIQKNNRILLGDDVGLSKCTIIIKGENNHLLIKDGSRLRNMTIEIVGNGCSIEIGEKCLIGHGCYLSAKEENIHLIIGDECMLSRNVTILTSDGHPIFHHHQRINYPQSITIGNHVWLADDVTVLKGSEVGSFSVVGIHSVVTKSIPEETIAVGIPARIVKTAIRWEL
jgi:acetyltransferase-like isoleucine patch superfamily enzyme